MNNKPKVAVARRKYERPRIVPKPTNATIFYVYGERSERAIIKVGITDDPNFLRQKAHEQRGPDRVVMIFLAALWATRSDESAIKREFAYASTVTSKVKHKGIGNGEWFTVDANIRNWLLELRKKPYVVKNPKDILNVGFVANSNVWLPPIEPPKTYGFLNNQYTEHTPEWNELNSEKLTEGDYYSPPDITQRARKVLWPEWGIELDPASCKLANDGDGIHLGVGAHRFYDVGDDGLGRHWYAKTVWLNPPYNQWDKWLPHAYNQINMNRVYEMLILGPAGATTAAYFHSLVIRADAFLIPPRRWSFWGPKAGSPEAGSFLFYLGPRKNHFKKVFKDFGTCVSSY